MVVVVTNHHKPLLTHLQVVLRVPVRVKDNAGVSSGQVDPQSSCSGAQEKNKAVRVRFTEAVDGGLSQIPTHAAVDAFICIPEKRKKK